MYDVKPNLIIGFHGCDASVRDSLLRTPNEIKISQKPFDWLGHGLYFWENNYDRALQWANEKKARGAITHPAVIGAALYLGYCCDFLDRRYIALLANYFSNMEERYKEMGKELPQNKDLPQDTHKDKIMRHLDCAAIEHMHAEIFDQVKMNIQKDGYSKFKLFDTVRGVFTEGGPAFRGAGLFAKSHIQICVRNPNCIQGFFMPREEIDFIGWLESNSPVREAI
jgi:hypothetical protein